MQVRILCLVPFVALSQLAHAQQISVLRESGSGDSRVREVASDIAPASYGFRSYDNWRYPNAGPPLDSGITRMTGRLQTGGAETGDDVHLIEWQPSRVSDWAYTMFNFSTTQDITVLQIAIRLYDSQRRLICEEAWWSSGAPIYAGTGARIFTDGGSELRNLLRTEESMFMTIQFSNTVGYDVSQIGLLVGTPITTGSSSRFAQNFTTGESIDLGEDNNLGFFIDTVPIPTPASASIALIAAPLALRRRR